MLFESTDKDLALLPDVVATEDATTEDVDGVHGGVRDDARFDTVAVDMAEDDEEADEQDAPTR